MAKGDHYEKEALTEEKKNTRIKKCHKYYQSQFQRLAQRPSLHRSSHKTNKITYTGQGYNHHSNISNIQPFISQCGQHRTAAPTQTIMCLTCHVISRYNSHSHQGIPNQTTHYLNYSTNVSAMYVKKLRVWGES